MKYNSSLGEPMRRVPQGIPQNIEWESKRNRGGRRKVEEKDRYAAKNNQRSQIFTVAIYLCRHHKDIIHI